MALAYLFPGQGSQVKGMGADLFDRFPDWTSTADTTLGYSIRQLCLEDPRGELGQTAFTQPALYVVGAMTHRARVEDGGPAPAFLAGHSLGEYCALFAAGVFDFETGLRLVKRRGELMSQMSGGGMAAVIGLAPARIREILESSDAGGRVDVEMAMQCVGDAAGLSLDDALFAATIGDLATADRALEQAMAEGAAPVGVLRAGLMHLQRLYRARLLMDTGLSAGDAAKAARPPVFFRRVGAFTRALALWPAPSLEAAMAGLSQAERNCKRTGWPDDTLSRHAVLNLARRAQAAR